MQWPSDNGKGIRVRLVTMHTPRGPRLGVWQPAAADEGGEIIDTEALARQVGTQPALTTLADLVAASATGLDTLRELLAAEPGALGEPADLSVLAEHSAVATAPGQPRPWRVPFDGASLAVPVHPPAILCAGENYRDHLDEKPASGNGEPEFFLKAPLTVAAPGATIGIDRRVVGKLDGEAELGVIIGAPGRNIRAEHALEHVFGYTVVLDMTARDRQLVRHSCGGWMYDLVRGKNFDGACPVGPAVVTADEIPDPQALRLRGYTGGELRQDAPTGNMIWPVAELIAYFSRFVTLAPGTLLATGTPGGTAWGYDAELGGTHAVPGRPAPYVTDGQQVTGRIDGIGTLTVTARDLPL